ncbi:MAG: type IV pilus secretin PilQ [Desulfobacterales bacterium]|nr:type IV pilus secretin PilQ [Desulfobacterales bacterium]
MFNTASPNSDDQFTSIPHNPSSVSSASELKSESKNVIMPLTETVSNPSLQNEAKQTEPVLKPVEMKQRALPNEKISLEMRDVEIAVLLRVLAKAANLNMMITEHVKGKMNLNIQNAAWDEVFLGLLQSFGLTFGWYGDILRVITLEDMKNEMALMETEQQIQAKRKEHQVNMQSLDLKAEMSEPMVGAIIHIDYADPKILRENLVEFLKINDKKSPDTKDSKETIGMLGAILVDPHTNSLMIQAKQSDLDRLIPLIKQLDRPTRQILIEAHIVETNWNTARDLGIQWGGLAHNTAKGQNNWITSGSTSSGALGNSLDQEANPTSEMAVNLPAIGPAMTLGYVAEEIGKNILTIQLSALEKQGKLNILSSPSITTLDNQSAVIESGKDVPFLSMDTEGKTTTVFKKAVLKLEVTPHLIDDSFIKVEIKTNKDELDFSNTVGGNPTIVTKHAETTVVLKNGETTVIGGLNKEVKNYAEMGVPWLKDIPLFGYLFKNKNNRNDREEVLIFITPRIITEASSKQILPQDQKMQLKKEP